MKLTLKPAKLTDDQLFGVIQIKAHPHDYVLNIEVDKKGYDNLVGCDPNNFLATLTVINEKLPHLLNAYETSIITNFFTTVGIFDNFTMRIRMHPIVEEKQKIFKSPSHVPVPDRDLTVIFTDGEVYNKVTCENDIWMMDNIFVEATVKKDMIQAWAYTDELLKHHNITLPEPEPKAEPSEQATADSQKSPIGIVESAFIAMMTMSPQDIPKLRQTLQRMNDDLERYKASQRKS